MAEVEASAPQYKQFLIVNNVQKAKNIRNMLTSASAFGVSHVFVVGQKKWDLDEQQAILQTLSCPVTRMNSLRECREHCEQNSIRIVGVEIFASAKSILEQPFQGHTAFIMGNEVRASL